MSEQTDDGVTYTVTEFGRVLNDVLGEGFPDGVWLRGEIKGLSVREPHVYFTIVDDEPGASASLSVQFFRNHRTRLQPLLERAGVRLADGLKVRIAGRVDFFAPRGSIGLKMDDIDPRFTLGELALQREELVRRLKESGLYERNRTRPLAPAPLRLGVVTSADSAAWADFSTELARSGYAFQVSLVDVRVQGERAVVEVPRAIAALGRRTDLDALVVIRGGGSRTDLAPFDTEEIATAIATCPLPVFTGIGHEIDTSVADEVAFRGLKTPTACAVELVGIVGEFVTRTEDCWREITHRADMVIAAAQTTLGTTTQAIRLRVTQAVDRGDHHLTSQARAVRTRIATCVERAVGRVDRAADALRRSPTLLDARAVRIDNAAERLRLLDPETTMSRGWSITRTHDGRVVRDAADLSPGAEIVTTFARGSARSRVEETTP